ncbi:MAG: class I SAM-dependent methyltransferase [Chitinophagales bacterium]
MKEFWNERYSAQQFAYGIEPNTFFKTALDSEPAGALLLPAEGEGRNAVYAATKGWKVSAFDISEAGKQKAESLAEAKGIRINYTIASFSEFQFTEGSFDCLALIFCHMPPAERRINYQRLFTALKPGGLLIVQGFSKKQLGKTSGGPKELGWLFSAEELREDFSVAREVNIEESEEVLNEGPFHHGLASLISLTARK